MCYDSLSRWYAALFDPFEQPVRRAGAQRLALQSGEIALELGCGTGASLVSLARTVMARAPEGSTSLICGVDIAWRMCAIARDKLRHAGLDRRTRVIQGDARQIPCPSRIVDALLMSLTLELFADDEIPRVLGECYRVLRDGGRLCVVALAQRERFNLLAQLYERLHYRFPHALDCRPIPVRQVIEATGFRVCDVRHYGLWGLPVDVVLAVKPAHAGPAHYEHKE